VAEMVGWRVVAVRAQAAKVVKMAEAVQVA
jgi:hypothetical protein